MKKLLILLTISIFLISCDFGNAQNSNTKTAIISKIKLKTNNAESDTLWVSQNDASVFIREEGYITRPCSNPEFHISYSLKEPKVDAYYFIYNPEQQLVMEGKYTMMKIHPDKKEELGNLYNSKSYTYRKNGKLHYIHYMVEGRNGSTETYDRKKRLTKISYRDKKSGDTNKVEIYRKGKLKETRNYYSFSNYTTVKAED